MVYTQHVKQHRHEVRNEARHLRNRGQTRGICPHWRGRIWQPTPLRYGLGTLHRDWRVRSWSHHRGRGHPRHRTHKGSVHYAESTEKFIAPALAAAFTIAAVRFTIGPLGDLRSIFELAAIGGGSEVGGTYLHDALMPMMSSPHTVQAMR